MEGGRYEDPPYKQRKKFVRPDATPEVSPEKDSATDIHTEVAKQARVAEFNAKLQGSISYGMAYLESIPYPKTESGFLSMNVELAVRMGDQMDIIPRGDALAFYAAMQQFRKLVEPACDAPPGNIDKRPFSTDAQFDVQEGVPVGMPGLSDVADLLNSTVKLSEKDIADAQDVDFKERDFVNDYVEAMRQVTKLVALGSVGAVTAGLTSMANATVAPMWARINPGIQAIYAMYWGGPEAGPDIVRRVTVLVPADLNAQAANIWVQTIREAWNNATPVERVVQRLGALRGIPGYNIAEINEIQQALLNPIQTTVSSALKVLTGVASVASIAAYLHYKHMYVPAFREQYFKNWKERYPKEKEEISNAMKSARETPVKAGVQVRVLSQQRELEQDLRQPVYSSDSPKQAEELSKKLKAYLELKETVLNLPRKEAGEDGLARMRAKKGPRDAAPGPHGGWMKDGEEYCGAESNPVPFSGLDEPNDGFEWKCSMQANGNYKWTQKRIAAAGGRGRGRGVAGPLVVDAIVDAFLAKRLATQQLE